MFFLKAPSHPEVVFNENNNSNSNNNNNNNNNDNNNSNRASNVEQVITKGKIKKTLGLFSCYWHT